MYDIAAHSLLYSSGCCLPRCYCVCLCICFYCVVLFAFFSVCTFLLATHTHTHIFLHCLQSMLFLYRIFAQYHIFSCEHIFFGLLFRSVYLFIPHTHSHIYLFRPFVPPQKSPKWFFWRVSLCLSHNICCCCFCFFYTKHNNMTLYRWVGA